MKENLQIISRCTGLALVVIAALLAAPIASAHQDPTNATGTGVSIALTAFRADGVTPVLPGNITQCETIFYQATLCYNASTPPINAAFFGGELYIQRPGETFPGTQVTNLTTGTFTIPCVGGSDPAFGCDPALDCVTSQMLTFTASPLTVTCDGADGGTLIANAVYQNGIAHIDADEQVGIGGTNPFPVDVVCCLQDGDVCNGAEFCDPTVVFDEDPLTPLTFRQGTCADGPNAVDSTACTDTDGNLCTTSGCDNATGLCDQDHLLTECPDDGNVCNGAEACVGGACVSGPNADDSTVCADTDGNACTTSGCDNATGLCDQTHVTVTCIDPICDFCVEDPTATGAGTCIPRDPVPAECIPGDEICRTPGFWGTHGGDEKEEKSQNITQALLDAYNNANATDLTVCGQVISTTEAGAVTSALEAICVSPKGDSSLQLARQLTAAALNCIITNAAGEPGPTCDPGAGLAGDVCAGVSIQAVWEACNDACIARETTGVIDPDGAGPLEPVEFSCINAIDCFNNGFLVNEFGECTGVSSGCHTQDLVNGCFDFAPPGAAGSPRECNEARKNCVSIFGTIPGCVP